MTQQAHSAAHTKRGAEAKSASRRHVVLRRERESIAFACSTAHPRRRTPPRSASPNRTKMVHLKVTKGLTWPFLALALATTLVYMAGLAALQAGCGSLTLPQAQGGIFGRAAFGASDFQCNKMFRFYWFIFAFVMVTLLGLLICAALKLALHWSRPFWVGMLTISILLMMIASEFFLGFDNAFDDAGVFSGWEHNRWRAATAGAIMSVVSLILLLLAVGTDWDRFGHGNSHHRDRDDKVTGTTTTTTQAAYAGPVQNVRVVDEV